MTLEFMMKNNVLGDGVECDLFGAVFDDGTHLEKIEEDSKLTIIYTERTPDSGKITQLTDDGFLFEIDANSYKAIEQKNQIIHDANPKTANFYGQYKIVKLAE